jgi:hypothetical protein
MQFSSLATKTGVREKICEYLKLDGYEISPDKVVIVSIARAPWRPEPDGKTTRANADLPRN